MKPMVRIAVPEDAAKVREVYAYYIEHTEASYNETLKPLSAYTASIENLLEVYPFLIAEDEDSGTFLGFANAEPVRPQSGYRYSVELTIYLHPAAPQRHGIGKLLYEKLFAMLKEQGFVNAYGVVNAENNESLALHEHFGFTPVARLENVGCKHGKWLTCIWLHKQLNPPMNPPKPPIPFAEFRTCCTVDGKGRLL
ncbi:MAG: GNAT family N-acetyltransferase [Eubacteriales bacterium]|nr:GNAT family N-acetyltransferase [Eubacteriales bacterium]